MTRRHGYSIRIRLFFLLSLALSTLSQAHESTISRACPAKYDSFLGKTLTRIKPNPAPAPLPPQQLAQLISTISRVVKHSSSTPYILVPLAKTSPEVRSARKFEQRKESVKTSLESKFPHSLVEFVARGGEGMIFRITAPHGYSKIIKLPLEHDNARAKAALVRESEFSKEARQRDGGAANYLTHSIGMLEVVTPHGTERGLVMEEANEGSLRDHLGEFGPGSDPLKTLKAWKQIALGVGSLHGVGVVHRDIKPDNILIRTEANGERSMVAADLGLSRKLNEPTPMEEAFSGTLTHMSENQLKGGSPRIPDDMRGIQVTFMEMLAGKTVWNIDAKDPHNHVQLVELNEFGSYPWMDALPDSVAQQIHPELRQIAEKRYFNVDELLRAIDLAEIAIRQD